MYYIANNLTKSYYSVQRGAYLGKYKEKENDQPV